MRQNLVAPGEAGRAIVARNVRVQSNVGILASATMKTILIPTEDHDAMPAVLESARIVAKTFDSYMEGFAVHPAAGTYVAVEPVSSLAISGAYEHDAQLAAQARTTFENFMRAHDVPAITSDDRVAFSYGWPRAEAEDDLFIGSYGRLFDLIALGRPGRAAQNPRMPPLEAGLFDSGRPALIAPPTLPKSIGKKKGVGGGGRHPHTHHPHPPPTA